MLDFEHLHCYRENNRLEAKQALGGLPESIWETYSAFANTCGGIILLGVEELPDKRLNALNLLDPQWLIDDFWTLIQNPEVASINILTPEAVQIHSIEGNSIISITVPEASPSQKPVYVGNDLYRGSFRRSGDGDYRLTKEEVDSLLARNHR